MIGIGTRRGQAPGTLIVVEPRLDQCVGALPHDRNARSDYCWIGDDYIRLHDSTWGDDRSRGRILQFSICGDPGDGPDAGQGRGALCSFDANGLAQPNITCGTCRNRIVPGDIS